MLRGRGSHGKKVGNRRRGALISGKVFRWKEREDEEK